MAPNTLCTCVRLISQISNPTSKKRTEKNLHLKFESLAPKIEPPPPPHFFKSVAVIYKKSIQQCVAVGGRSPTGWNNSISLKLQIPR